MLHSGFRFEFVASAHLPRFKTVIQRLAADTLNCETEGVIKSLCSRLAFIGARFESGASITEHACGNDSGPFLVPGF